jgi:hypothetical protein
MCRSRQVGSAVTGAEARKIRRPARAQWQVAAALREAEAKKQHEQVDAFEADYRRGDLDAVVSYCSMVLEASAYPEGFPQRFKFAYVPESRQAVVEYELPTVDVVPAVRAYRYVKASDTIAESARPQSQIKALYASVVAQVAIRTVHEHPIFTLDKQFARRDGKIYPAGTVFVRRPGRTVQAEPGDIRALAERFAAPALAAEAHARRMVEIEETRLAAEAGDRERRWLTDLSKLVSAILFKAAPYRESRGQFRCEEQMQIQTLIADRDLLRLQAEMPELVALSGAGQGMETFAAAARANIEIQTSMRNLAAREAEGS